MCARVCVIDGAVPYCAHGLSECGAHHTRLFYRVVSPTEQREYCEKTFT